MTNKLLLQRLEGVRQALVALFESSTKLSTHTDVIGDEREIFVSQFLGQILPPQYRIGSGVITDAQGKISTQLDIVIELPFTPSFSFIASTPRVYLADTIGAVIEIKSNLKGYLTGAKQGNAEKKLITGSGNYEPLKRLERDVMVVDSKTRQLMKSKTIPAYVVGYKGQKKDTLRKHLNKLNRVGKTEARDVVRGILQLEPPIFVGSNDKNEEGDKALGAFINSLHWELHRTSPLSWPNLPAYFGIERDVEN